jgi:hypothetical protein
MTVAALPSTITYIEDGVTVAFPAPFRFKASSDLIVERLMPDATIVVLTLNVDYTVTGGETDAGGTVTRTAATNGAKLRISRQTPRQQPMVYTANDRFPAESHEEALDRLTLIVQEQDDALLEVIGRSILLPIGEGPVELPIASLRTGGMLLGFDPTTGATRLIDGSDFVGDPGPAGNVAANLIQLKAAALSNVTMLYNGVPFTLRLGDYDGLTNDDYIVASDLLSADQGAWVQMNLRDLNGRNGLVLSGKINAGVRPEGQLQLYNDPADPGHTIISLVNAIAGEETAIESVGYLSNGATQQQGAWFWRWWRGINHFTTKEVVQATHLIKGTSDVTPQVILGRNTVILCGGATASEVPGYVPPWEWDPPENFVWIYTKAKIGTSLFIGPTETHWDTNVAGQFRLEVEGRVAIGAVAGTAMGTALQMGIGGATDTFIQSHDGAVFRPMAISASDLTIGAAGQKLAFLGATPVVRQEVTGVLSAVTDPNAKAVLTSMLSAIAVPGLVTASTT